MLLLREGTSEFEQRRLEVAKMLLSARADAEVWKIACARLNSAYEFTEFWSAF